LTDNQLEISKVIAPELFKLSEQKAHLLKIITGDGSWVLPEVLM